MDGGMVVLWPAASDGVRLSGIGGYHCPDHPLERQIGAPDDDDYLRLCRALIFTPDAIGEEGESCSDCLAPHWRWQSKLWTPDGLARDRSLTAPPRLASTAWTARAWLP
jgi:hypothetical protein